MVCDLALIQSSNLNMREQITRQKPRRIGSGTNIVDFATSGEDGCCDTSVQSGKAVALFSCLDCEAQEKNSIHFLPPPPFT